MPKALTKDDVIIQIEDAEFEVHESLVWRDCDESDEVGMEWDGGDFVAPTPVAATWDDVTRKQSELIEAIRWRVERHITQEALGMDEQDMDDDNAKYTEILQYLQDIRDNDEDGHANADDALAALNALSEPA